MSFILFMKQLTRSK